MAMAKSPTRRLNSENPKRTSGRSIGRRTSASNSSSSSAVVIKPLKNSGAGMRRTPRVEIAIISASRQAATAHHSEAGSACAIEPQNVPRVRIGRCAM